MPYKIYRPSLSRGENIITYKNPYRIDLSATLGYCGQNTTGFYTIDGLVTVDSSNYCPQTTTGYYDIFQSQAGTWNPSSITPYLWLDATDNTTITLDGSSRISQWRDKSGNGFHANQSGSNGFTLFDFTPSLNFRQTATTQDNTTSRTFLECLNWNFSSTTQQVFCVFRRLSGTNNAYLFNQSDATADTNGNAHIPVVLSNTAIGCIVDGTNTIRASRTIAVNTGYLFEAERNGTAITNRLNGEATGGTFTASANMKTMTRYWLNVNSALGTTLSMAGNIGEILIFNSVLSQTNRELVQGYLAWKWYLQDSLPSGHPYKNVAPS